MTNTLSAYEQQYRSAKDIRSRLMGKPPVRVMTSIEAIKPKVEIAAPSPMWKIFQFHFDAHVVMWRSLIKSTAKVIRENEVLRNQLDIRADEVLMADCLKRPARLIIDEVLEDFPHLSFSEIKSKRRTRDLVEARHRCIYEIYTQRPDMSYPAIGKIFGIDHTSAMFAVRRVKAKMGDKEAQEYVSRKKVKFYSWLEKKRPDFKVPV